ncbi:MAG TPA: MlaD family protein [Marmoricola sp.]|nr:MlaD family protein [Marmoricola sp.]
MITRGVKIRLLAFVILSAVGVVWVAGNYLGVIDKVFHRGVFIHVTLPDSGGLYEGSQVTMRGVRIGEVKGMHVQPQGLKLDITLQPGTELPKSSQISVHNLSAVGEQYLDFVPESTQGPYAVNGTVLAGDQDSLPIGEDVILTSLNDMVGSINGADLSAVVAELGTMFRGTSQPLQQMVDAGTEFVQAARANEEPTITLFETAKTVLQTQAAHEQDIKSISTDLASFTGALADADANVNTLFEEGPATAREVTDLMNRLGPVLPVFLANLISVNQVITANLAGLEQLMRTFPAVLAGSQTGTPGDFYGHINLQFNQKMPVCTGGNNGYLPEDLWRPATDIADNGRPPFPARCTDPNLLPRGSQNAPGANRQVPSPSRDYTKGSKARQNGADQPSASVGSSYAPVFSQGAWQDILVGPVTGR